MIQVKLLEKRYGEPYDKDAVPTPNPGISFDKYLKSLALKRKLDVTLVRLKPEIIQLKCKTHWTTLDPYSDLEEMSERGDSETLDGQSDMEPSGVHFSVVGGYVLCNVM